MGGYSGTGRLQAWIAASQTARLVLGGRPTRGALYASPARLGDEHRVLKVENGLITEELRLDDRVTILMAWPSFAARA